MKRFTFKAHLDLFQKLALDLVSTMGSGDQPAPNRLCFIGGASFVAALEEFPAFDGLFHQSNQQVKGSRK
jgi:hypothetical protein